MITSFTVSWLKNRSSNCCSFGLAVKTADSFTASWQRKGQIFAPLWSEVCRHCQILKLQHKLAFLNSVTASEKHITIYSSYCKAVRSCCTLNRFLLPVTYCRQAANRQILQFNPKWTLNTNSPTWKQYISFVIRSPNKPNHNNITILHPTITVPFHSYTQHICQSHPQHRWHKLLQFNKLPPTESVCVWTQI